MNICATTILPQVSEETQTASLYDDKIELLVARYYYLRTVEKSASNEEILVRMRAEFFISTNYIAILLSKHVGQIQQLRKEAPKKEWFRMKWAHLVW